MQDRAKDAGRAPGATNVGRRLRNVPGTDRTTWTKQSSEPVLTGQPGQAGQPGEPPQAAADPAGEGVKPE